MNLRLIVSESHALVWRRERALPVLGTPYETAPTTHEIDLALLEHDIYRAARIGRVAVSILGLSLLIDSLLPLLTTAGMSGQPPSVKVGVAACDGHVIVLDTGDARIVLTRAELVPSDEPYCIDVSPIAQKGGAQ